MSWTRWPRRTPTAKDSSQYLLPADKQPPTGKARRTISSLLFKSSPNKKDISAISSRNYNGPVVSQPISIAEDGKHPNRSHFPNSDVRLVHEFNDPLYNRFNNATGSQSSDENEPDYPPDLILNSSMSLPPPLPSSTRSSTFPTLPPPQYDYHSLGRSASSTALRTSKSDGGSKRRPGTAQTPTQRRDQLKVSPPRRRTSSQPQNVQNAIDLIAVKESPPPPHMRTGLSPDDSDSSSVNMAFAAPSDNFDWVAVDYPESPTFAARLKRTTSAQGIGNKDKSLAEDGRQPRKQRSFHHHPMPSVALFKASTSVPSSPITPDSPVNDSRRNTIQPMSARKRLFSAASSIREKCDRRPSSSPARDDEPVPKTSFSTVASSSEFSSNPSFTNPFLAASRDVSYPTLPTPPSPTGSDIYYPQKIVTTEQLHLIEAIIQNETDANADQETRDCISLLSKSDDKTIESSVKLSPSSPSMSSSRHSMVISSTLTPPRRPSMRPSTSQGALSGTSFSLNNDKHDLSNSPSLTLPPRHKARPGALVSEHPTVNTNLILSTPRRRVTHDDMSQSAILPRRPSFLDIGEDIGRRSTSSNFLDLERGRESIDSMAIPTATLVISPLSTPPL